MIEPTKEQLAETLREYPTWGHAYVAEKARADGLEEQYDHTVAAFEREAEACHRVEIARQALVEQFEAAAAALRWISSNHPKVIREMPTDLYRAMMEPALSNPANEPEKS